jgi:membrane-bound ClpP family serine protease
MATIVILLVCGAVLLLLETFLPGLIAGTIGGCCLLAAIVFGYRDFGMATGNGLLAGVILGLSIGAYVWLKYFPESRIAKRFISQSSVGELGVDRPDLLNCTGTTLTALRPSGMAKIQNQRVDVVTEGGFIERGSAIKVVGIEGSRVVVRGI